jgi:hypothetical protein
LEMYWELSAWTLRKLKSRRSVKKWIHQVRLSLDINQEAIVPKSANMHGLCIVHCDWFVCVHVCTCK